MESEIDQTTPGDFDETSAKENVKEKKEKRGKGGKKKGKKKKMRKIKLPKDMVMNDRGEVVTAREYILEKTYGFYV
jgi:hypothetical protein